MGLILLLLTGVGRQRARRQQQPVSPAYQQWQFWGNIGAFGLLLIGLLLMTWAK